MNNPFGTYSLGIIKVPTEFKLSNVSHLTIIDKNGNGIVTVHQSSMSRDVFNYCKELTSMICDFLTSWNEFVTRSEAAQNSGRCWSATECK